MTREKAVNEYVIPALKNTWNEKVCAEVINALEQEPVLDKIRAEIEQEYLSEGHLSDYWDGVDKCLQIIDKYNAESEVQE